MLLTLHSRVTRHRSSANCCPQACYVSQQPFSPRWPCALQSTAALSNRGDSREEQAGDQWLGDPGGRRPAIGVLRRCGGGRRRAQCSHCLAIIIVHVHNEGCHGQRVREQWLVKGKECHMIECSPRARCLVVSTTLAMAFLNR